MRNKILKFRAWDGLNKKFSYWSMNDLCTYVEKEEKPSPFDDWQQDTGLTDINNKKIFEKDIIKMWIGEKSRTIGSITYGGWQYSVTMEVGGKEKTNYFGYNGEDIDPDNLEVVGNVFENPELLNE